MAIVLPESVFDTTENKYIRLFLFWYFDVLAVVSLPQLSFQPYTQTKTSVLFARKKTAAKVDEWATAWSEARSEWSRLRTRVQNYIKVHVDGEDEAHFPSITSSSDDDVVRDVQKIIGVESGILQGESITDYIDRHKLLSEQACEADAKPNSLFGLCNTTWVFGRLVRGNASAIFSAEVSEVGYKRSQRRVMTRPNELYDVEVAPSFLNIAAIRAALQTRVDEAAREVEAVEQERKAAARPTADGRKARKVPKQLDDRLGAANKAHEAAVANRDTVLAAVEPFYDADGHLLPLYADRTDERLREVFSLPELAPYRSDNVIVRRSTPLTVLEEMRKADLWSG